jgi:hypothetical protein
MLSSVVWDSSVAASVFVAGLGLTLSLIAAIGAQNTYVLRQGLRREHVALVVLVCVALDAALMALGISGLAVFLASSPVLLRVVAWLGAAALAWYAWQALGRALQPQALLAQAQGQRQAPRQVLAQVLGISLLNPHLLAGGHQCQCDLVCGAGLWCALAGAGVCAAPGVACAGRGGGCDDGLAGLGPVVAGVGWIAVVVGKVASGVSWFVHGLDTVASFGATTLRGSAAGFRLAESVPGACQTGGHHERLAQPHLSALPRVLAQGVTSSPGHCGLAWRCGSGLGAPPRRSSGGATPEV